MTAAKTPEALSPDARPATGANPRWAGLAGREHRGGSGRSFVFLHGLTFDCRMWDPVLDALAETHKAIALDLPGHGSSAPLGRAGLRAVVEAVHEAVCDAGLDAPIIVGHSIGGALASMYAASHPATAVVSIDSPIRVESFAGHLLSAREQLTGPGFDQVWAQFRRSWQIDLLTPAQRELLRSGERGSQQQVLSYQADLLDGSLEEIVRQRDEGLERLRLARMPYVMVHASPVDSAELTWLARRLPQAESLVWPVGHHFPHVAHPERLASLLTGLAAATPPIWDNRAG